MEMKIGRLRCVAEPDDTSKSRSRDAEAHSLKVKIQYNRWNTGELRSMDGLAWPAGSSVAGQRIFELRQRRRMMYFF